MTDTIPSTLRMLQDRDADRIGYGQDRDLRDRPEIKMSMFIPNVKGWFGYLKPGYVIEGNRTSNSYTGGFERSREGNREVTPVSGESSIAQAGYGYNYPMQFWPSRNNTQQPVGFVTPNKDDPNAIASIRFRPQLRTVNFEPNKNKGWWGYWDPVAAPLNIAFGWFPGVKEVQRRDASPKFLLGYKDVAYDTLNLYRSRHAMPCTGGAMGQVTCLPCMGSTVNNAVTGQNTQCEVLSFSRGFQNIPQVWKDVMNEAGVEWRDGRPTDIENLKVQDLFPCPMPDLVHRLGPANIPHDVMSSLGVTDVQDDDTYKNVSSWGFFSYANFLTSSNIAKPYEGVTLPNGRPQPYSYDQKGKDTPEANFYTCEYKSGAIDSTEKLKTFLEYVNEGEVAPCCTSNPSESCTFVPGNATIPFLQGMPDDFAANMLTNFEINFAQKQRFCDVQLSAVLNALNDSLNSVTIRSGKHGKLRTAMLNLRTVLMSRETIPTDSQNENNWKCFDANAVMPGAEECARCDPDRALLRGPDVALITPIPESDKVVVDSVPKARSMLCGPNFTRKNYILRKPADFWLEPRLRQWGDQGETYLDIFRSGANDESRRDGMWTHQAVADKAAPPNWYEPPFEIMCYDVQYPLWHDYEWVSTMRDPNISCKYFKPQDCVLDFLNFTCDPSIGFYANDDPRLARDELTDTITTAKASGIAKKTGKKFIVKQDSCGGEPCPAWEWGSKSGKKETIEEFTCEPTYEAAPWDRNSCECAGGEWRDRLVPLQGMPTTQSWYHELGCRILPNSRQLYDERFSSAKCSALRNEPTPDNPRQQCFVDIPYKVSDGPCLPIPANESIELGNVRYGLDTRKNTTNNPAYMCKDGKMHGVQKQTLQPTTRKNPVCRDIPLGGTPKLCAVGNCNSENSWLEVKNPPTPTEPFDGQQFRHVYFSWKAGTTNPEGIFSSATGAGLPCPDERCHKLNVQTSVYDANRRQFAKWAPFCICDRSIKLPEQYSQGPRRPTYSTNPQPFDPGMGIQIPNVIPSYPDLPQPLLDWTNGGFGNRIPLCQLEQVNFRGQPMVAFTTGIPDDEKRLWKATICNDLADPAELNTRQRLDALRSW
jgi:hypothetical protein